MKLLSRYRRQDDTLHGQSYILIQDILSILFLLKLCVIPFIPQIFIITSFEYNDVHYLKFFSYYNKIFENYDKEIAINRYLDF